MSTKPLALLVAEMSGVVGAIVEAGGELSPELESLFDNVQKDLAVKCDGYAFFMDRLDSEEKFWKERAENMVRVARSIAGLRERLKDRIKEAMVAMETTEIKGEEIRFKLSKLAPKLVVDELTLPMEYKAQRISYVPDKDKIQTDLSNGCEIPGVGVEPVFSLRKYLNKKGS